MTTLSSGGLSQVMTVGSAATRKNSRMHCAMVTRRMSALVPLASSSVSDSAPGRLANRAVAASHPLRRM